MTTSFTKTWRWINLILFLIGLLAPWWPPRPEEYIPQGLPGWALLVTWPLTLVSGLAMDYYLGLYWPLLLIGVTLIIYAIASFSVLTRRKLLSGRAARGLILLVGLISSLVYLTSSFQTSQYGANVWPPGFRITDAFGYLMSASQWGLTVVGVGLISSLALEAVESSVQSRMRRTN